MSVFSLVVPRFRFALALRVLAILWLTIIPGNVGLAWQGEEDDVEATNNAESDETAEPAPAISTESLKANQPEVDPRFLRFEMWDGTVVSGVVGVAAIDVDTEFGRLTIPIERLVEFRPGMVSLPEVREKVMGLVEQLGDREFKSRETAHRELVGMGPLIAGLLSKLDDGGDAERKKHLVQIREEVQSILDEQEEEDDEGQSADRIGEGDRIQTPDFAIVGKIQQEQFEVTSKIGDLRILLSDVKRADRGMAIKSQVLRKKVFVSGSTFFQKEALNTKIRVSKGDKISISASGVVQWTNWNQTASPDGLPNQGNWNGLSNGSLAARIGKDGSVFGIGSDHSFRAEKSGILYLGIAMPDNYVNNAGYRWTGKFKTRIKVEPAE